VQPGRVFEYDFVENLFANPDSEFKKMYEGHGGDE
jgi:hypothetical protein